MAGLQKGTGGLGGWAGETELTMPQEAMRNWKPEWWKNKPRQLYGDGVRGGRLWSPGTLPSKALV